MNKDLPFPLQEYRERLDRVAAVMAHTGLDAAILADPEDLFYLTGYRNMDVFRFQVLVLCPGRDPVMVLREMAKATFDRTSWTGRLMTYADHQDPASALRATLIDTPSPRGRIAVPTRSPYFTPAFLELAKTAVPQATWVDGTSLVRRQRLVKSPAEIAYVRQACRYAERAVLAGAATCRPGRTENHVAAAMLSAMIEAGSETPAKNPLVGAGPRSALGHVSWEGRAIHDGNPVFLEPGACVRRYHAAIMRSVVPGRPSAEHQHWGDVCRAAVNAAIASMRPSVTADSVDAACRQAIESGGLLDLFHHRTGYSIGLGFSNWIEDLSLRPEEATPLQAGMVFHVVPFLTDGRTGIAVSEMVLVTSDGAERLTQLPQGLLQPGDPAQETA